jgi:hypothetical protein
MVVKTDNFKETKNLGNWFFFLSVLVLVSSCFFHYAGLEVYIFSVCFFSSPCQLAFFTLFYRWNTNCHKLGAVGMKYTPGWAVGWFFIPFANVFMALLVLIEIWKVSSCPQSWKEIKLSKKMLFCLAIFWFICFTPFFIVIIKKINALQKSAIQKFLDD